MSYSVVRFCLFCYAAFVAAANTRFLLVYVQNWWYRGDIAAKSQAYCPHLGPCRYPGMWKWCERGGLGGWGSREHERNIKNRAGSAEDACQAKCAVKCVVRWQVRLENAVMKERQIIGFTEYSRSPASSLHSTPSHPSHPRPHTHYPSPTGYGGEAAQEELHEEDAWVI